MRVLGFVVACALVGVLFGACGITNPSSNSTDTFSGVVSPGTQPGDARNLFTFIVNNNGGEYSATITALSPDTGATVGIARGQMISNGCGILEQTGLAGLNRTALSAPITKGTFCIEVFDNGLVARPETYTLSVSHP